jgi:hypothetical protein
MINNFGKFNSISAIKGLRLLWIFYYKSSVNWSSYMILLDALKRSLMTLINIALILWILIYISSVIAMWLF